MKVHPYWFALRWYLIGWMLVSLIGYGMVMASFFRQAELDHELMQLGQQLRALQQDVTRQTVYLPEVAFYQSHQSHWQQQGPDHPANPNLWMKTWSVLQQQGDLPHMQYEIQPYTACENQTCTQFWPVYHPGLSMTMTPVKLRWLMRHESEVLDWLKALQLVYDGMLLVRGCVWSIAESTDLIAAECEVHWFNFPSILLSTRGT